MNNIQKAAQARIKQPNKDLSESEHIGLRNQDAKKIRNLKAVYNRYPPDPTVNADGSKAFPMPTPGNAFTKGKNK